MSRILLLHTGGTIGMTKTENGYQPDGEYFRQAVFHMDSLKKADMPEWDGNGNASGFQPDESEGLEHDRKRDRGALQGL